MEAREDRQERTFPGTKSTKLITLCACHTRDPFYAVHLWRLEEVVADREVSCFRAAQINDGLHI